MPPTAKKRGRWRKLKKTRGKKKINLNKLHKSTQQKSISHLFPYLLSTTAAALAFLRHHDLHLSASQSLSLESLLSSTSISLTKLLSLLSLPPPSRRPPPPPPPPHSWFHRFLSSTCHDDYDPRWAHFFNLSKASFTLLLRLLSPSLSSLSPLPSNYALAATLFRLSHGASFSAVARRFDMDSGTACRAFYTVCKAVNDQLGHLFEFKSDINRVIVGFGWISLPNCCGVLGIERFEVDGDLLGENGSLLVQGLVDSEGRFLDVSAGWPSTVSPDNVLKQSGLFSGVEESKEYLNGPCFELNDGADLIPQYILGKSCFPLSPWLLTPYKESYENEAGLSESEMAFNSVHRRGMELVRMAFARVKTRWKLVAKKWKEQCIEAFPFVIVACCLLHNFLIKCSEELQDDNVELSGEQVFPVFEGGEEDENGKRIRDALASHLGRVVNLVEKHVYLTHISR